MSKSTKCWYVYERGQPQGEFVFAETRNEARRKADTLSDEQTPWIDRYARREPKLDGKEITDETIEAAGYWTNP